MSPHNSSFSVPTDLSDWLTVDEAKARLRISHSTIYRHFNDGSIRAVKRGRRTFVCPASVEARMAEVRRWGDTGLTAKPVRPAPCPLEQFRFPANFAWPTGIEHPHVPLTLPILTADIAKMA